MKLLTLRIAKISASHLTMSLISLDPGRRISTPSYDVKDHADVDRLFKEGAQEFRSALRSADQTKLAMLGRRYADMLVPRGLREALLAGSERFLYLDLDEGLVIFPWELLILDSSETLSRRFFLGRHQRLPGQRANPDQEILKRPVLLIDPSGNLPNAAGEGTALKKLFASTGIPSVVLSSAITRNDALARMEEASLLHYSGHSTPDALVLADGLLTGDEIERCDKIPFFVFLNSCAPAAPEGWDSCASNLTKAFQRCGSHVVLCPVTLIDGRQAAAFAVAFYTFWLGGLTVGEAFYRAADKIDPSGLFGANYVLYGNPILEIRPSKPRVTQKKSLDRRILPVLTLAILIGLVTTLSKWKKNTQEPKKAAVHSVPAYDVPKDERLALQWFKKRTQTPQASGNDFRNLGVLLYRQAENFEDMKAALTAYKKAVELGDPAAAMDHRALESYVEREGRIERLLRSPEAPLSVEDYAAAKTLASRLSGPCPSPTYGGLPRVSPTDVALREDVCARFGPHIVDSKASIFWFSKLGSTGNQTPGMSADPSALVELGRKFESGDGVAKNFKQAAAWYLKAAEAGDPYACSRLGYFYQHGLGVDKKLEKALQYRKMAVKLSAHNPNLQQIYQADLDEFVNRHGHLIKNDAAD